MPKPTPLQVRNIIAATLMGGLLGWNLLVGGTWWLSAIFALACALSIASAVVNRPKYQAGTELTDPATPVRRSSRTMDT